MSDAPSPPRARKRPRQARSQATWDALVEAAAQLLAARGLANLTTNAIAERAGVSIGSLYQYFPNRDALMLALIERQIARQRAALAEAATELPGPNLRATVTRLVRAAMAQHAANPVLATAIDHEEARLPAGSMIDDGLAAAGKLLTPLFAAHRNEIGPVDLDAAAATLPVLVRSIVDVWANRQPPDLAMAEGEAVRAVIGYLTTRS